MMGVNKVIVNDSIKLDLTADTVTADTLANGVTAHNAAGDTITGTFNPVTSFNGRTGAVTPQTGDYSYDQISNTPTAATTTAAGLMSAADKTKLDGIEDGATNVSVDTEVTESSTNAVSGGAVYTAIEAVKTSLTPKKLTATLAAGETSITITDDAITDSSRIYVATSVFGVEPTDALQYGNTLTLTFDAQTDDITITVYVY